MKVKLVHCCTFLSDNHCEDHCRYCYGRLTFLGPHSPRLCDTPFSLDTLNVPAFQYFIIFRSKAAHVSKVCEKSMWLEWYLPMDLDMIR